MTDFAATPNRRGSRSPCVQATEHTGTGFNVYESKIILSPVMDVRRNRGFGGFPGRNTRPRLVAQKGCAWRLDWRLSLKVALKEFALGRDPPIQIKLAEARLIHIETVGIHLTGLVVSVPVNNIGSLSLLAFDEDCVQIGVVGVPIAKIPCFTHDSAARIAVRMALLPYRGECLAQFGRSVVSVWSVVNRFPGGVGQVVNARKRQCARKTARRSGRYR